MTRKLLRRWEKNAYQKPTYTHRKKNKINFFLHISNTTNSINDAFY